MIVWRRLADLVSLHGAAALVTVHAVKGSAPREAGARMVVRPDGAFHGTIGGGQLEWQMLGLAREALARGRGAARFVEQALGPDLGQCCGGRVTVLIETFDGRDLAALQALAAAESGGAGAVEAVVEDGRVRRHAFPSPLRGGAGVVPLGDRASDEKPSTLPPSRGRVANAVSRERGRSDEHVPSPDPASQGHPLPQRGEGGVLGGLPLTQNNDPHLQPLPAKRRGEAWIERLSPPLTPLALFGAGHVGRALILALAPLPFSVRWIDSRDDAFPPHIPGNATPVHAADPTAEVAHLPADAVVLVMTHEHSLDLAITAAALQRDCPFIGLIGSETKRARFEKRFRELGIHEARIAALACPIGLPGIGGKEPAVIAASTVAQLLQVREKSLSPGSAQRAP